MHAKDGAAGVRRRKSVRLEYACAYCYPPSLPGVLAVGFRTRGRGTTRPRLSSASSASCSCSGRHRSSRQVRAAAALPVVFSCLSCKALAPPHHLCHTYCCCRLCCVAADGKDQRPSGLGVMYGLASALLMAGVNLCIRRLKNEATSVVTLYGMGGR